MTSGVGQRLSICDAGFLGFFPVEVTQKLNVTIVLLSAQLETWQTWTFNSDMIIAQGRETWRNTHKPLPCLCFFFSLLCVFVSSLFPCYFVIFYGLHPRYAKIFVVLLSKVFELLICFSFLLDFVECCSALEVWRLYSDDRLGYGVITCENSIWPTLPR